MSEMVAVDGGEARRPSVGTPEGPTSAEGSPGTAVPSGTASHGTLSVFLEARFGLTAEGRWAAVERSNGEQAWRRYAARGQTVRLVARATTEPGGATNELGDAAVVGPLPPFRGLAELIRSFPAVVAAIHREVRAADTIVLRMPGTMGLIAAASARVSRRRYCVEVVGDAAEVMSSGALGRLGIVMAPVVRAATRWAVRGAASAVYVTRETLQRTYPVRRGTPAAAVSDVQLGPGEFTAARAVLPAGVPQLIAVGSQEVSYKGHDVLLRAHKRLQDRGVAVRTVLVGGGRLHDSYVALAAELGLRDVELTGPVGSRDRLTELLDGSALFVMPSLTEGLPRALVEAMARGLPVVASRVGGIPELVDDDCLVPPGDDAALADAIERALSDGSRWAGRSSTGVERAHGFAAADLNAAYARWLRAAPGTRRSTSAGPARTRVVHVIGRLERGGAETVALDLCRAIPPHEVEQVFVTLGGADGRLAGQFEAAGAVEVPCTLSPFPTFPLRFWRLLRRLRPDAVVSHVSLFTGVVTIVAAAAGVRTRIARMHSEGDGMGTSARRRVQRAVLRWTIARSATHVLGVTGATLAFAGDRSRDRRYAVLPNGVDIDRFAGVARRDDGLVLTHVGRMAPEKNRGFLLGVLDHVQKQAPDAVLEFVGPGGAADLTAVDPDVERNPAVRLAGETDHVEQVLAGSSVLMLPSVREGLPGVVLEALAAGVPVVATDLPGLRELAAQVDGLHLLPLEAGPGAWADAAVRLGRTDAAGRAGITASLRASAYGLDESARRWTELWRTGQLPT